MAALDKWVKKKTGDTDEIVVRPKGWDAATFSTDPGASSKSVDTWKRDGHLYRGMTEIEFNAHMKAGHIQSTGKNSAHGEGTNFSDDPVSAEGYANFGRDDPRKTGKPNYLVEVKKSDIHKLWPDGYYKAQEPTPLEHMTRYWKMEAKDGAVVAREYKRDEHGRFA